MNLSNGPLSRYNRLQTHNADELKDFLAKKALGVEVPPKKARRTPPLHAVINAFYLPGAYVSYLRYRTPVALVAHGDRPDYSLSLPAKGTFCAQIGAEQIHGGYRTGTLGSPTLDQRTVLNEESSRYGISISQAALVRQLESLLGRPMTEPLRFTPKVDLGNTAGRSLQSLVQLMVDDLSREDSGFDQPLVATQFEQLLISILLSQQPHNYTKRLESPMPAPASRDVKRALDYIHEHLQEPISLVDLVEVSGVAGRSLHAHFRRFTGKSPLAYVAEQRLARARDDLKTPGPGETVTTIATRWGFTQLGRFSGTYRKTYGETPVETLRNAQQRMAA